MQDLGPRINYPVFLEDASEIPRVAVTLRYDEFTFFIKSGWETNFSSIELVKKRLQAQEG